MMVNINGPVAMTLGIKNSMDADEAFAQWAIQCLARHLDGDWGQVGVLTLDENNGDPETALSVYPVPVEHAHHLPAGCADDAMWIKQDGLATTMLWPVEW